MAETPPGAPAARRDSTDQRVRETAWLHQVAQGGPQGSQALFHLVQAYRPKMLSFFRYRGMAFEDVEDLMQNLWVRVVAHAADFDPDHKPSTWIWTIARRLQIDESRRPHRRLEQTLGDDLESTLDGHQIETARHCALPGESVEECVRRGLEDYASVHEEGAAAVQLRDLEGWDIADLARFLERTEGATRTFLSQVRKKLEPFLMPCFELLSN